MTPYWPLPGPPRHDAVRTRLIVSLDPGTPREALQMVDRLASAVGMFKVGRSLFRNGGPDFVREIRQRGGEVFLDLRFHDTPQAVVRGALEATRLGVRMFDLHPYGGFETIERVRAELARLCRNEGLRRPSILAVVMLARVSSGGGQGNHSDSEVEVKRLAKLAADASLDGVFTLPHETAAVRAACGRRFTIVSSGPAPHGRWEGFAGWRETAGVIRAGADYLVVGSPIWRASDPLAAVREIAEAIERELRVNPRSQVEPFPVRPA